MRQNEIHRMGDVYSDMVQENAEAEAPMGGKSYADIIEYVDHLKEGLDRFTGLLSNNKQAVYYQGIHDMLEKMEMHCVSELVRTVEEGEEIALQQMPDQEATPHTSARPMADDEKRIADYTNYMM